jgi:IS1 family transposase/transposase-like protein
MKAVPMLCKICGERCQKYGKTGGGTQRYFCRRCYTAYSEQREPVRRVFDDKALSLDKAIMAVRVLMEGTSIRGACRLLNIGQYTLLDLVRRVGDGCRRLHNEIVVTVACKLVECDEVWSYVWCKEKTRVRMGYNPVQTGDCYTWTAIESGTKLLLAYAIGKRDNATGMEFIRQLRRAVSGYCQINTDGLGIYRSVIPIVFGRTQDHATIVKTFSRAADGEARYSPPKIVSIDIEAQSGWPNLDLASTSHVERSNLTIRMMLRRFTRLTNAHSRKWENHVAAQALLFAYYNLCRVHMTLGTTPAVEAGLSSRVWSVQELVERAVAQAQVA